MNVARNLLKQNIKAKDLVINETEQRLKLPEWDPKKLVFGAYHTDHMLICDWDKSEGWGKPVIQQFGDFSIHPFNSTLHYSLECFEGTKAYKTDKGIRLFRCDSNMHRFKNSCASVALPDFDGAEFQKCIEELIKLDHMWVPPVRGFSLYIRPTGISMEASLGVKIPTKARIFCVISPVGPYYPSGFQPIKLYCDPDRFRAAPHGTGNMKIGGNYGPTIPVSTKAAKLGYQQILWLWNEEICEVGTSNIFFYWINEQGEKELVTPSLDQGYILPGVTRDSILDITRDWGRFKVTERKLEMKEIVQAIEENRLIEAFGAGTAVIVCPIEGFFYKGKEYKVPINPKYNAGDLTRELLHFIQDIQYGIKDYKNYQKDIII